MLKKVLALLFSLLIITSIVDFSHTVNAIAKPITETQGINKRVQNQDFILLERDEKGIEIKDTPIEGEPPLGNPTGEPTFKDAETNGWRLTVSGAHRFYLKIKQAGGDNTQVYRSFYEPDGSGETSCQDSDGCSLIKGTDLYPWFSLGSSQNDRSLTIEGYNFSGGRGTKPDVALRYSLRQYENGWKYELKFEDVQESNRDYEDLVIEIALQWIL